MVAKRIAWFLTCLCSLAFAADARARQPLTRQELAGTYVAGHNFGGSSITLKVDGGYDQHSGSCTFTTHEAGRYVLEGGLLRFTILKYTGRQNGAGEEVDLFDPKARGKFFGHDEGEEVEPLKTEFRMLPVKWRARTYLIFEDRLQDFSNAVNLGLEPRETRASEPYYGLFFLRDGDEGKGASGRPSLPARWRSFLLDQPVTALVVAVEGQGETAVAVIDRGSRSGLKAGMKLVVKGQPPAPWSDEGLVLSVDENSAKVRVSESNVGDTLGTKYVRPELF